MQAEECSGMENTGIENKLGLFSSFVLGRTSRLSLKKRPFLIIGSTSFINQSDTFGAKNREVTH